MDEQLFRETLPLGLARRSVTLAALLGAGFAGLWRVVAWRARPGDGLFFALVGVTILIVVLLVTRARLITTVSREGVQVELAGLGDRRTLRPAELRGARVGVFDPLIDDDGWGRLRSVRASNAWGPAAKRGVWLERSEAPALFLPSHQPEELASAIMSIV